MYHCVSAERQRSGPLAVGFRFYWNSRKQARYYLGPEEGSTRLATFRQLAGIRQF
jgi:hypothetical protein